MRPIVLLTDFGMGDWFPGTLEGVIGSIAPAARVIHLTHGIARGDVQAGAFNLWAAFRWFPEGSIFVAVVDPGVGGPRDALLVMAHGRAFLGPDNGLLAWATGGFPGRVIRVLENPRYRLGAVSRTFHGRDVFAPAAAHLHRGTKPARFGKAKASLTELPPLRAAWRRGACSGTVVHVDGFGNAITSIREEDVLRLGREPKAAVARGKAFPWKRIYGEAGVGGPLSLVGSCGLLELAVNGGSAADRHSLRVGDAVRLT